MNWVYYYYFNRRAHVGSGDHTGLHVNAICDMQLTSSVIMVGHSAVRCLQEMRNSRRRKHRKTCACSDNAAGRRRQSASFSAHATSSASLPNNALEIALRSIRQNDSYRMPPDLRQEHGKPKTLIIWCYQLLSVLHECITLTHSLCIHQVCSQPQ